MTAEILRMPNTKLRLHCSKCGVTTEANCDCGVGYVTAGKAADKAVKEHPEMSDRALAEMIGVSDQTIGRARHKAVATNVAPEKRTGKDGKSYPGKRKAAPKHDKARDVVRPLVEAGEAINRDKLAAEHGLTHGAIQRAEIAERARLEARADPVIDPTTLSLSAQEKLAAALRQQKQTHERQFQQRVEDRVNKWIEETTIASYADEFRQIRDDIERRTGIMTAANYKLVLRCLHPDNSASTKMREEAFVLWEKLRYRFCDNTEMPVPLRGMPENAAGWEALRRARQAARKAKRNGSAMEKR